MLIAKRTISSLQEVRKRKKTSISLSTYCTRQSELIFTCRPIATQAQKLVCWQRLKHPRLKYQSSKTGQFIEKWQWNSIQQYNIHWQRNKTRNPILNVTPREKGYWSNLPSWAAMPWHPSSYLPISNEGEAESDIDVETRHLMSLQLRWRVNQRSDGVIVTTHQNIANALRSELELVQST